MSKKKILCHILFLFSPLLIIGVAIFLYMINLVDIVDPIMSIMEGYAILFLLICSYLLYFKMDKLNNVTSKWEASIIRVYPTIAAMMFGWFFLLPFMRETVGMWDIQFLDLLVTLALGYFVLYFIIGVYHLILLFFPGKEVHS